MGEPQLHELARGERLIAGTRVVLAAFALIVLLIDPDLTRESPDRLLLMGGAFALYAVLLAVLSRRPAMARRTARLALQLSDFLFFSGLIFLTHASVSPFFIFFLFSLVTALLRFGVPGMIFTSGAAILVYVVMALADENIRGDPGYLVMRSISLALATLLLARLGTHYTRIRNELTKLASWPRIPGGERDEVVREIVVVARDLLSVERVLLCWDEEEEPWVNVAMLGADGVVTSWREAPDFGEALVGDALREATFLQRSADGRVEALWPEGPREVEDATVVSAEARARFGINALLSAPVRGQSVNGRIFFLDGDQIQASDLAVADLAARLVAATLDHLNATIKSREAAVAEERLRVGRDLHDGVLQSLTGVALQLEMLGQTIERDPRAARERLRNLQELIATDQRELRTMISQLRPKALRAPAPLHVRLSELAGRFERQWDVRVSMTIDPAASTLPETLVSEVYSTINEAVANAAKHSGARTIDVAASMTSADVLIVVTDDGGGFPFHGAFTLDELTAERRGPVTLKERVASLAGDMLLESSAEGTRLEIRIPLSQAQRQERRSG